jgi:hypothetical protein
MQLSRRGFIGALTGAVASGPKAAVKLAEPLGIDKILIHNLSVGERKENAFPPDGIMGEDKSWAKKKLAKWFMPGFSEKEFREHTVYELHPDLYSLRSMSLSAKMRIQKRRSFEQYKKKDMTYLERYLKGELW